MAQHQLVPLSTNRLGSERGVVGHERPTQAPARAPPGV